MIDTIDFVPGDIVRVHQLIKETDTTAKGAGKEKTRIQIFEGVVLGIKGRTENKSFTVRKMVEDISIERIFPVNSPSIKKVEIKGHLKNKTRRAKLTYLKSPKK
jgi:large subunit ribosomal protein L19